MDKGTGRDDLKEFVVLVADRIGSEVPVVDHSCWDDSRILVVAVPTEIRARIVTQSSHIAFRFWQQEGGGGREGRREGRRGEGGEEGGEEGGGRGKKMKTLKNASINYSF